MNSASKLVLVAGLAEQEGWRWLAISEHREFPLTNWAHGQLRFHENIARRCAKLEKWSSWLKS